MKKLLQISTCGMKNIENRITIDFANSTIEGGIKKINNVKGIFGFNGAGKTAFISSVDLYKNIITDSKYLLQNSTVKNLDKLLNYKLKCFTFSIVFEHERDIVVKHTIKVEKSAFNNLYAIVYEDVAFSMGRTINEKYKSLITKENGVVKYPEDEKLTLGRLGFLNDAELDCTSIITKVIEKVASDVNNNVLKKNSFSIVEKAIVSLFANVNNMLVYLSDSDSHSAYVVDKDIIEELINGVESFKRVKDNWTDIYLDETIIKKDKFNIYQEDNKKLEKFIKTFKPELKEIYLDTIEDGELYHIRRIFKYQDYNIELEFESSGIKQLVKLFTYLLKCSKGAIVFIDEVDVNINAVYFEKLVSFFKKYGDGQLIFTTHNIEAMNALKDQSRSIVVLGVNNKIDTWVGKGNKSPIKDYIGGFFPNSPMNIEDFDFVNIFLGEE